MDSSILFHTYLHLSESITTSLNLAVNTQLVNYGFYGSPQPGHDSILVCIDFVAAVANSINERREGERECVPSSLISPPRENFLLSGCQILSILSLLLPL